MKLCVTCPPGPDTLVASLVIMPLATSQAQVAGPADPGLPSTLDQGSELSELPSWLHGLPAGAALLTNGALG